ncbi:hypothetical protein N7495_008411 [Penicillium taxi]|uniref:uncharacterized protein n=1 Tax=Penicillium taxi TaxID=168475 RepID=UPI0025458D57|nr:uncharacterized protein N7495_008411 [Penicillium taxi]KAJ5888370.1 hypothetical protein N7495_008411 [Penicillium taxi]
MSSNEEYILLGLSVAVVVLRLFARWSMVGFKGLKLDDYVMPLACVTFGFEAQAAANVGKYNGLSNAAMSDEYRANLSPDSLEYAERVEGSKIQLTGWGTYVLTVWLLKACMAIFYSRMTEGLKTMQLRVKISYVVLAITFVAVICSIYLSCQPFHKFWQINPNPGNQCLPAISNVFVLTTVVLNILTDIFLLTIPIPVLAKAQLKWRAKLRLLVLFSGGIFVMVAALVRCILILTAGANGPSVGGSWSIRETFVATIINNLPMIYPLVRRVRSKFGWSSTNSGTKSQTGYTMSSKANTDLKSQKRSKFRNPLGTSKEHEWNNISDEQVILAGQQDPATFTTVDGNWDNNSAISTNEHGIKVVQETIVERSGDR